jgi:outer membrane protein assembly factor BamD
MHLLPYMRHFRLFFRLAIILSFLCIGLSCSKYQKLLKSDDHELKYTRAIELYDAGEYGKSITLLTDIIPVFRGTARAEQMNYYYAMAHFKLRDYTLASHYFRSFATGFPNSEHVEEFLYLSAYSKYLESPRPSLDQTSTMVAIQELQAFINRFPSSVRVAEANNLIDELRLKLETKRYDTAVMYYRIMDYVAAATTFASLIRDFPDTKFKEEAFFYIIQSHYDFAINSIPARQTERFQEVIQAYNRLIRNYPESQYLVRAERMKTTAASRIEELQAAIDNVTEK